MARRPNATQLSPCAVAAGGKRGHRSRGQGIPTRLASGPKYGCLIPVPTGLVCSFRVLQSWGNALKLLSLFLKVAGSIPGVVKFPMLDGALFFCGGACGGRRDKPNQHGARTDASPPGRVSACYFAWCAVCFVSWAVPKVRPPVGSFARACRSAAISVRTPRPEIPGP